MTEPEVGFTGRTSRPNRFRIAAVLGASLAVVIAAAVTIGASPSPTATTGAGASASPQASGSTTDPGRRGGWPDFGGFGFDGRGGFGERGGPGGLGHAIGRDITITAINGSNLILKTDDGWTRTIAVTSSTTITKGGEAAMLADLAVGDEIRFRQTRSADGSYTIDAVEVVVPTVSGTVTAVDADSITIKGRDGTTREIATTSSTTYRLGSGAGTRADVVVGATILAAGTVGTDDAFTATSVTVAPARGMGTVTAKTASTITIERRDGTTVTVNVDADTAYMVAGVTDADLGDVTVGMQIVVSGRESATNTIDASAVLAGDVGRGHHGGWDEKAAPSASPDAPSNDG
ncbi:MAG TPA: DUF5666 domain-containing protein [Candidatus Limnocylindrales bacterium]|nr:DUF5666 domain-containing protein [Candidatus Limnocylindrales bacterium]